MKHIHVQNIQMQMVEIGYKRCVAYGNTLTKPLLDGFITTNSHPLIKGAN